MNIENIDEVEVLIQKLRVIQDANLKIETILDEEDGGAYDQFALVESESQIPIYLPNLKAEIMEAIQGVTNSQYDKIMSRLREL